MPSLLACEEEGTVRFGNRDPVLALYLELREPLLHYALRHRVDLSKAEELVQEAFLALVQQRTRRRLIRQPRAWLFRVVRNLILRQRRNERAEAPWLIQLPASVAEEIQVPDPHQTPAEAVLSVERDARLMTAIAELSDLERECLELRAEGLSYREIAEVLSASPSTVGDWVRRAILTLRRACEA